MILLVDAYNLFKTVLHVQYISDGQRNQFLNFFDKYAQFRPNNKVILVFDGGENFYEVEQNYKHITILYSGTNQIADDVIKKKLYAYYQSYDVLLVTCDRELRRYAANYGIESLGSLEFYKILQNIMQQPNKEEAIKIQAICKTSTEKNPDLDMLMELASRNLQMKIQDKKINIHKAFFDYKTKAKKDKKLFKKIVKI